MYEWENRKCFKIRMAGLVFEIRHHYNYIRARCADYVVDSDAQTDIFMEVAPEYFSNALHQWLQETEEHQQPIPIEERVEFACVPVSAYYRLVDYNALWLHATVVEYRGEAYAFTARSGYGKTTHARLWLEAFGDEARIINGDNPILRMIDGQFYAFGTPFCGKEGYHVNVGVPLRGICYLTHAQENSIRRMDPTLAVAQLACDNNRMNGRFEAFISLYDKLVAQVPVYQLYCNMDPDAARVAWEGMRP